MHRRMPFDCLRPDRSQVAVRVECLENILRTHYLETDIFCQSLKARCYIGDVADRGVIVPARRADLADHRIPGVEPDTDLDRRGAFPHQRFIQLDDFALHSLVRAVIDVFASVTSLLRKSQERPMLWHSMS